MLLGSWKISTYDKWTSERSEAFISDRHGRDHVTKAEAALIKMVILQQ